MQFLLLRGAVKRVEGVAVRPESLGDRGSTMKYRHAYHAGNFADVHKHVTLLALLAPLQRKDKGFLYLTPTPGAAAMTCRRRARRARRAWGVSSATSPRAGAAPLRAGLECLPRRARQRAPVSGLTAHRGQPAACPGSGGVRRAPGSGSTRAGAGTRRARTGRDSARLRVERGNGFERLRAFLPPPQRRGLTCSTRRTRRQGFRTPHEGARRRAAALPHRCVCRLVPDQGRAQTRAAGKLCQDTAGACHGERAVAVPTRFAGGAERLRTRDRQSAVAHARAHAGVAAAAAHGLPRRQQ